jgi:tetratricopeptide (TPR) repeat protein
MVPETLQALIAHQLAQCSPAAQALLAAASVAGVEFAAAAVAACLERTDDEIEAQCATLAHHGQFLQARGRAEWPDGTITACFGFRHALYHDVVYQRIPAGRQTRWHARIGTRLAQGFGAQAGDLAAALARHCVRGRLLPQAVPYLRQAGETAMARSAHREAAGYFEQALGILSQLPEAQTTRAQSFDLWLALRTALLPAGDFERILAALRAAEALAVALDDPQRLGQVVVSLSVYYCFIGAYDQAVAAGQHTLALATASGEIALPALAHQYLGLAYYSQGDYRRAIDSLGQTVACLDGAQHREHFGVPILPAVNARAWLARCHAELGTFAAGRALGEEGLRIAEGVAHPASRMVAAHGSGLLALRRGDLRQALPRLAQAMGICQEVDLPLWFALIAQALGVAYTLAKRLADALPLLTRALEHSTATASVFTQAPCCLALGQAQLLAGHLEEAHARATQALALARAHQERGNEAYALRLLGDLAARHAPPAAAQAEAHYRQALALAEALGMRPLQAHCHRRLGMLYAATGQREQARSALLEALARYRAMQMTFWLPQTETALAQVDAC